MADFTSELTPQIKTKEIVKEWPITKINCSNLLYLYRFPNNSKSLKISEVKYKPTSKLTELKAQIPTKSASALKLKNLNTESIAFRAFPSDCNTCFYARVEDDKISLYPIQNTYLFQPFYFYYPFEYTPSKLKKAESREEFEHRMRSINFKLKNVNLESYRTLPFDTMSFIPKLKSGSIESKDSTGISLKVDFKSMEETIKRTRIVNIEPLLETYHSLDAIKSTLFKMTERLEGRFILKNSYYERSLHEIRSKLIQVFKSLTIVRPIDVDFLKRDRWLVEELADLVDGVYKLKGTKESFEFDSESIKTANLSLIRDLLKNNRILNSAQISTYLSLNEEIVTDLLQNNDGFFHLSNNSFALNDENYLLNDMFNLLLNKKSFELTELTNKLEISEKSYNENTLIDEIKKYCVLRGGKFYLKIVKE